MRWLTTLGVYVLALLLTAAVAGFLVILLAGPHAGLLPHALEVAVILLGWLAVLVLPALAARAAWRRHGKKTQGPPASPPTLRSVR